MKRRSAVLAALSVLMACLLFACSTVLGFDDLLGAPAGLDLVETGSSPNQPDVVDGSQGPADVIVIDSPTGVAVIVSASQNPSIYGSTVAFTAAVAGNGPIPTGTVTFTDGAASLGTIALESTEGVGRAVYMTSTLTAGVHTVTATYDGDSRYMRGSTGSSVIDVKKAATITTLESTPNPAPANQTITFTATLTTGPAVALAGNVSFKEGGATLGTIPVSNGIAVLSMALAGGVHSVVATYEGDANFAASSSAALNQSMTGPACQGLAATCGAGLNFNCCASAVVPGGTFSRSYDGTGSYNDPNNMATVSAFALDTFEITVARYRAFVMAGKGTQASPPAPGDAAHPAIANSGWAFDANLPVDTAALIASVKCNFPVNGGYTWTDAPGANENKPMNCLTWYDAFAFCAWDGGRLATEAEWNFTAAAGSQQRVRPWSSPPSSTTVSNLYAVYNAASVLEVGSRTQGNGFWGHSDLSGNVWEWVLDYGGGYPNPCNDCANLTPNANRIFRGGGYVYNEFDTTSSRRGVGGPGYHGTDVGGRCARAP